MKKCIFYLIVVFFFLSTLELGADKDFNYRGRYSYFTPNINLGFTNIDVKHYRIEIEPFWNTKSIKAICTIKLLPTVTSLDTLKLDCIANVDSVWNRSGKLAYSTTDSVIIIALDKTYSNTDTIEVSVAYNNTYDGFYRSAITYGERKYLETRWRIMFSKAEFHVSPAEWFPCNDLLSDKSDNGVEMLVTCDDTSFVASNGLLKSVTHSQGKATYYWKHEYPIETYLISIAVSKYDSLKQDYKGMPVIHYFHPIYRTQWEKDYADFPKWIETLSQYAGEYPFLREKCGVVAAITMEHQTILGAGITKQETFHELAHQWFGNLVTCQTWYDAWLNEGFATYCEFIYLQDYEGQSWGTSRRQYRDWTIAEENWNKSISEIYGLEALIYHKGATILEMLRLEINDDELFWKAMRGYLDDYAYKTATTTNYINSMENYTGKALRRMIAPWIDIAGHPIIEYDVKTDSNNVEMYLEQIQQKKHSKSRPFPYLPFLEIRFNFAQGDTIVKVDVNAGMPLKFKFSQPVISYEFDPSAKLLAEYEQKTGFTDNRTAVSEVPPKKSRILNIYPNPVLDRTSSYIKYELSDDAKVELNCYDITGRFIGKIFEGNRKQGRYITGINNKLNLSHGVYIIELIANHERRDVKKIVVMKR